MTEARIDVEQKVKSWVRAAPGEWTVEELAEELEVGMPRVTVAVMRLGLSAIGPERKLYLPGSPEAVKARKDALTPSSAHKEKEPKKPVPEASAPKAKEISLPEPAANPPEIPEGSPALKVSEIPTGSNRQAGLASSLTFTRTEGETWREFTIRILAERPGLTAAELRELTGYSGLTADLTQWVKRGHIRFEGERPRRHFAAAPANARQEPKPAKKAASAPNPEGTEAVPSSAAPEQSVTSAPEAEQTVTIPLEVVEAMVVRELERAAAEHDADSKVDAALVELRNRLDAAELEFSALELKRKKLRAAVEALEAL